MVGADMGTSSSASDLASLVDRHFVIRAEVNGALPFDAVARHFPAGRGLRGLAEDGRSSPLDAGVRHSPADRGLRGMSQQNSNSYSSSITVMLAIVLLMVSLMMWPIFVQVLWTDLLEALAPPGWRNPETMWVIVLQWDGPMCCNSAAAVFSPCPRILVPIVSGPSHGTMSVRALSAVDTKLSLAGCDANFPTPQKGEGCQRYLTISQQKQNKKTQRCALCRRERF